MTYSFQRYLAAKKSVDDRALNRGVWEMLAAVLPAGEPLRVLEIGAGVGTMVERVLEWGLATQVEYTGIDEQAGNIAAGRERLQRWGAGRQLRVRAGDPGVLDFAGDDVRLRVFLEQADAFEFAARAHERPWDLLIAHAFLDLVDVPAALPRLFALLRPGGLFYFTINFDGVTSFQPEIDPEFDAQVELLYHRTMDERITAGKPSGDSRAGRHLFGHVRAAGAEVLAAGPSDWVVFGRGGEYAADEAYFLHFIVETMRRALAGQGQLDAGRFERWIAERHAQIERGELVYVAHQLDFLGRVG